MADIHARLVLIRHGQSEANAANVFTGWSDPPLTAVGRDEAGLIAHRLLATGLRPARIFCSVLGRCTETVQLIRAVMETGDMPVIADAALNERDYGALTGLDKSEAGQRYGEAQVRQWRRAARVRLKRR